MNGRSRADLVLIGQQPGEPGRATKYDPIYCDEIRLWAEEGLFPETWAARIGVHKVTLYRWANDHPEFEEATLQAWALLQDYWTRFAQDSLRDKDLRSTVLIKILQKRFPALYGGDDRLEGTLEHFQNRNAVAPAQAAVPGTGDQPPADRAAMLARIAELQDRLKQREDK